MKKTISLLLLILIIGLLSACQEDEERSFSIDQVKIDAQIQDDGTIQVRELYTYSFDGKYQGTTRSIDTDIKIFKPMRHMKQARWLIPMIWRNLQLKKMKMTIK